MMMMMTMMMMMRCLSSLRVRAKPMHLPYIYIYMPYLHIHMIFMHYAQVFTQKWVPFKIHFRRKHNLSKFLLKSIATVSGLSYSNNLPSGSSVNPHWVLSLQVAQITHLLNLALSEN